MLISEKAERTLYARLIHCFLANRRNKVIIEKGKLHGLLNNKILFALKRSDYLNFLSGMIEGFFFFFLELKTI